MLLATLSAMTRPPKRARLSEAAAEAEHNPDDDKHTLFTVWAKERGVEIDSVAPQQLPGRGLGLMTTAAVKEGTRLLFVPERAMFKPDTAFAKRSGLERASPQAKLTVSIMAKFTAEGSELAAWEATWPTKQDFDASMPLSWPEELIDHLPPPVLAPLERQKADYARDWEAAKSLCEQRSWDEATFRYYWCIVNSRSFHWKPSAGRAGSMVLCPFVDYMNHGPTGSGVTVTQTSKGYAVVAERDYGK